MAIANSANAFQTGVTCRARSVITSLMKSRARDLRSQDFRAVDQTRYLLIRQADEKVASTDIYSHTLIPDGSNFCPCVMLVDTTMQSAIARVCFEIMLWFSPAHIMPSSV